MKTCTWQIKGILSIGGAKFAANCWVSQRSFKQAPVMPNYFKDIDLSPWVWVMAVRLLLKPALVSVRQFPGTPSKVILESTALFRMFQSISPQMEESQSVSSWDYVEFRLCLKGNDPFWVSSDSSLPWSLLYKPANHSNNWQLGTLNWC